MSIHIRFHSKFISYSGAIWRILTTSIKAAPYSRFIAQIKLLNDCKFKGSSLIYLTNMFDVSAITVYYTFRATPLFDVKVHDVLLTGRS